jgi:hypothetical protein
MQWQLDSDRHKDIQITVDYLRSVDPEFVSNQLKLLIVLGKAHLPEMTAEEVKLVLKALNGIRLPPPDLFDEKSLPEFVADIIRAGFIEEPECTPLRLEMEGGINPEWLRYYEDMPEVKFAMRIASEYTFLQAMLLVVMSECFWTSREHFLSEDPNFEEFFNICPKQK